VHVVAQHLDPLEVNLLLALLNVGLADVRQLGAHARLKGKLLVGPALVVDLLVRDPDVVVAHLLALVRAGLVLDAARVGAQVVVLLSHFAEVLVHPAELGSVVKVH
jgi:hypothetical protein